MTFIKTILIILLVYFGLKFLIRLATPYILRYLSKKANQRVESFFREFSSQSEFYDNQKEGKVSIDRQPKKNRKSGKKVGEYIDFEEID